MEAKARKNSDLYIYEEEKEEEEEDLLQKRQSIMHAWQLKLEQVGVTIEMLVSI